MDIARSTFSTVLLSKPRIGLSIAFFKRGLYENVMKKGVLPVAGLGAKEKDSVRAEPCTSFYVYTEMENEC